MSLAARITLGITIGAIAGNWLILVGAMAIGKAVTGCAVITLMGLPILIGALMGATSLKEI